MTRHSYVWLAGGVALLSMMTGGMACGGGSKAKNPACTNGICGTSGVNGSGSGGDSAAGSGSSGNGSGGDNAAGSGSGGNGSSGNGSGGNSGSSGSAGSGGAGGTGGPSCAAGASCQESWLCSPWQTAASATGGVPTSDNAGTRTCVDQCNCGTTKSKPAESETLPALDFNYYQCSVEPVLDEFCAQLGCHGTESGRALRVYARSKLRITGETWTLTSGACPNLNKPVPSESCIGGDECECWLLPHSNTEWQRNYDAARAFALDAQGQALGNIEDSELLKQPLRLQDGGLAHAGIHILAKTGAPYMALKNWLAGTGTGCSNNAQKSN